MFDPEFTAKVSERLGGRAAERQPTLGEGGTPHFDAATRDAIWGAWIQTTAQLTGLGFDPDLMCETAREVAELSPGYEREAAGA